MLSYTFFKREKIPEKEESKMKNVTRSVRFVLSMVLVMAMVLTSIGSFGTVAKAVDPYSHSQSVLPSDAWSAPGAIRYVASSV